MLTAKTGWDGLACAGLLAMFYGLWQTNPALVWIVAGGLVFAYAEISTPKE